LLLNNDQVTTTSYDYSNTIDPQTVAPSCTIAIEEANLASVTKGTITCKNLRENMLDTHLLRAYVHISGAWQCDSYPSFGKIL